jgi:hypothetical protein
MIESTHHPIDTWVREHVKNGEEIVVGRSVVNEGCEAFLMSAKELAWCYLEGRVPLPDIDRKQSMQMVKALNDSRANIANAGKKIFYQGSPLKYYWIGTPGAEAHYQQQLDNRLFWRKLIASQQGEIASENGAGYGESNKKY